MSEDAKIVLVLMKSHAIYRPYDIYIFRYRKNFHACVRKGRQSRLSLRLKLSDYQHNSF